MNSPPTWEVDRGPTLWEGLWRSAIQRKGIEAYSKIKPPCTEEGIRAMGGVVVGRRGNNRGSQRGVAFEAGSPRYPGIVTGILYCPLDRPGEKPRSIQGGTDGWLHAGTAEEFLAAEKIVKTEGPNDALALASLDLPQGIGILNNICGCSSSNPDTLDFSIVKGKDVIIFADADQPGQEGARRFAARFLEAGAKSVAIARLPFDVAKDRGKDIRDYTRGGATIDDIMRLIEEAEPFAEGDAAKALSERARSRKKQSDDDRPTIEIDVSNQETVVDEALAALAAAECGIYERGGMLTYLVRSGKAPAALQGADAPRIARVPLARLSEAMSASARWGKDKEDGFAYCLPPPWAVKAVDARPAYPMLPTLEAISECPVLLSDGRIIDRPGFDRETGIYLHLDGWEPLPVPEVPAQADIDAATELVLELVVDFPFPNASHRAAWVAALLTPFARHAFQGPSPIFLIDANAPASGKSLLADIISIVYSGRDMPRTTLPADGDETRKKITAIAMGGEQLVLFDNLSGALGNPELDAAVTGATWSDRLLGESRIMKVPFRTVFLVTGNNVLLAADTARLLVCCRLESAEERPEERTNFRHADLKQWVRRHRPELVRAVLVLLRSYLRSGSPRAFEAAFGSFDDGWSPVVRQSVVWHGFGDPCATRLEVAGTADRDAIAFGHFLEGWLQIDPHQQGLTMSEAIRLLAENPRDYDVLRNAIHELVPGRGSEYPSPRSVSMKVHHKRKAVVNGRYIDGRETNRGTKWVVYDAAGKA